MVIRLILATRTRHAIRHAITDTSRSTTTNHTLHKCLLDTGNSNNVSCNFYLFYSYLHICYLLGLVLSKKVVRLGKLFIVKKLRCCDNFIIASTMK